MKNQLHLADAQYKTDWRHWVEIRTISVQVIKYFLCNLEYIRLQFAFTWTGLRKFSVVKKCFRAQIFQIIFKITWLSISIHTNFYLFKKKRWPYTLMSLRLCYVKGFLVISRSVWTNSDNRQKAEMYLHSLSKLENIFQLTPWRVKLSFPSRASIWETVCLSEQIMSADKYLSIFWCHMKALIYVNLSKYS